MVPLAHSRGTQLPGQSAGHHARRTSRPLGQWTQLRCNLVRLQISTVFIELLRDGNIAAGDVNQFGFLITLREFYNTGLLSSIKILKKTKGQLIELPVSNVSYESQTASIQCILGYGGFMAPPSSF